ncbi:MAG TPA: amidase [Flavitalea sp.]|nr:amidase [Flavitalea sp.]
MKRRNFIKGASVAGLIAATGFSFASNKKEQILHEDDTFSLNEATIEQLQKKMKNGQLTSRKIVQLYLKRIKEIDKTGPKLNAIIELNPDALSIADKMDAERKAGKLRGPMHGIPVLVKDNINTRDKMMTTAGSIALMNHRAQKDAFIISRLRKAGAVILGKTNCSEWSNFRSQNSSSGWSSRGGQTRNACVLDRSPSGSSSGSAVAVAANLCVVAIGTETDGSIIAPSSFNGIVGIKPTVGLWSRSGIIPISKTQDTAGPMARTVRDAAIFLGVLCGVDEEDEITKTSEGKFEDDYTKYLDPLGLKGARIGIEKSFLTGHQDVVALYKNAIEILKKQGATIIEVDLMKQFYSTEYREYTLLQYEFKDGVNKYLAANNTNVKSLKEVIAFNKKNDAEAMPFFKQETLETSEEKGPLTEKAYLDLLEKRNKIIELIKKIMEENNLDVICSTSIGLPCAIDVVNGDYSTGFYFCPPAACAGYPHITVPMGKAHELPVGLSFMSGAYQEGKIIRTAYAFEQVTRNREVPKFLKTTIPG